VPQDTLTRKRGKQLVKSHALGGTCSYNNGVHLKKAPDQPGDIPSI
jgi:hypothetical protein